MPHWNTTSTITDVDTSLDARVGPVCSQTQTDASQIVLSYFVMYVTTPVNFFLSPLGLATSVVNIIVYCRLGISESVNITFLSLSLWNLITCFISCVSEVFDAMNIFAPSETTRMISIQGVLHWIHEDVHIRPCYTCHSLSLTGEMHLYYSSFPRETYIYTQPRYLH